MEFIFAFWRGYLSISVGLVLLYIQMINTDLQNLVVPVGTFSHTPSDVMKTLTPNLKLTG